MTTIRQYGTNAQGRTCHRYRHPEDLVDAPRTTVTFVAAGVVVVEHAAVTR